MAVYNYCPNCGRDTKEAKQSIEICQGGKRDDGVNVPSRIGHFFNCPCENWWIDWYRYDESSTTTKG